MTQAISSANSTSFAGELAAMLIEKESTQADSAKQQRDAARESFLEHAQQQVDALHDAADATMTGAFIGASMSIAGGVCQMGAASFQYDADVGKAYRGCPLQVASDQFHSNVLGDLAEVSSKLADPTKALVGDSTAARFQAEAKRSETLGEQAQWQADDASSAIDKAERRGDKVLDVLQGIQQNENSSTSALIGRI
jgi:hypothetical protein